MEDTVKGIKSQILFDWRNYFETRAQLELFIMQIDMLIESVEKECKLTQRSPDSPYVCLHCGAHISSEHLPWCKSLAQNGGR